MSKNIFTALLAGLAFGAIQGLTKDALSAVVSGATFASLILLWKIGVPKAKDFIRNLKGSNRDKDA
jgi:hypothetical protein